MPYIAHQQVKTKMFATDPVTQLNVTYNDTVPDRSRIWPPTPSDLTPGEFNFVLSEAHLSDDILHGLIWAIQLTHRNEARGSFVVLDANISALLTWHNMDFYINPYNLMIATVDSGVITGYCGANILFQVSFTNLTGSATLHTTLNKTTGQTGLMLEILEWYNNLTIDVIQPQIMLPQSVIDDLVHSALNSTIDDVNIYLAQNILWLPTSIAPYTPDAHAVIFHQDGCCDNKHGFFELSTECTCSTDPRWPRCFVLCTAENQLTDGSTQAAPGLTTSSIKSHGASPSAPTPRLAIARERRQETW